VERDSYLSVDGEDLRWRKSEPKIHPSADLKGVRLGRFCEIGPRCLLRDTTLGDYSYFERGGEAAFAQIGKFCSVAANVRINALAHPMERVTTHKISYRPNEYFRFHGVDEAVRDARREAVVRIGHDVWIGHGAIVMPGVTIGDGAVIGAGSVVTRDVAPYTIVAGSPARRLRERFPPETARRLTALAWWDWPPETLFEAIPDMQRLEIGAFLDRWEGRAVAPGG
jgi:phosphonate metabolism protein (transferase hexapeptide repeat family)